MIMTFLSFFVSDSTVQQSSDAQLLHVLPKSPYHFQQVLMTDNQLDSLNKMNDQHI